jgi:septin family protein
MRKLHTKVNLIPVIAKADTLTDDEVTTFKQRVSGTPSACQLHGIEWLYRKCSYS